MKSRDTTLAITDRLTRYNNEAKSADEILLEKTTDKKALRWVANQNKRTLAAFESVIPSLMNIISFDPAAHARRMVAKMQSQGHAVYYYESEDGGHGGTPTKTALIYAYLQSKLMTPLTRSDATLFTPSRKRKVISAPEKRDVVLRVRR